MSQDDRELVQGWQRGDAAAFEALVRRWQTPVARLLVRLVGRDDLAADLCQEVFLRVHQNRTRFRGESAFSTWVYRIALNVARDAGRRLQRELAARNGHVRALSTEAVSGVERDEAVELVTRALTELPEPLREVIILRHYEQMNFEQMARVTETPASTLKSRFSVAMRQLKENLERHGLGSGETP